MYKNSSKIKLILISISLLSILFLFLDFTGNLGNTIVYKNENSANTFDSLAKVSGVATSSVLVTASSTEQIPVKVTHIKTPEIVRAIYMTSCIASGESLRKPLVDLIDKTQINSVVVDVKDYTGYISIDFGKSEYPIGGKSCLVRDMKEFVARLHEKGVYVIARVAVMQDPTFAERNPKLAVKRKDNGGVWKDRKGLAFVDPSYKEFWDYIKNIAIDSYNIGFDEVNFDYVRYPTDGALSNMAFNGLSASTTKRDMMKKFYSYMGGAMKEQKIPSSVDLFGMTTTALNDLGIGQMLEDALSSFDYVAPMVYPSHYPDGFNGWKDPNMFPGPLTEFVMGEAVKRANAINLTSKSLRTWVQDFDYGKDYTVTDVRAIIKASENVGVKSYMVWDPNNRYTIAAYGTPDVASSTQAVEVSE